MAGKALAALLRETYSFLPTPFPAARPLAPGACLLLWGLGKSQGRRFADSPGSGHPLFFGGGDTGSATLQVTPPFLPSSTRRQWDIQGPCCDVDLQTGCVIGFQFDLVTSPQVVSHALLSRGGLDR